MAMELKIMVRMSLGGMALLSSIPILSCTGARWEESEIDDSAQSPSPGLLLDTHPLLEAMRAACDGDGEWNPRTLSCTCPPGTLFFAEATGAGRSFGCQTFRPDRGACGDAPRRLTPSEAEVCLANFYREGRTYVEFSLRGMSARHRAALLSRLTFDEAAPLRGVTLPTGDTAVPLLFRFAHPAENADIVLWHDEQQYPTGLAGSLGEIESTADDPGACARVANDQGLHANFRDICRFAHDFATWAGSRSSEVPAFAAPAVSLVEMSSGCDPYCTLVASVDRGSMHLLYRIRMVQGVPFQRTLRVADGAGHRYTAFMSVTGALDGQRFEQDTFTPQGEHLIHRRSIFAGRDGRILEEKATSLAPRRQLAAALGGRPMVEALPTDERGRDEPGHVKAAMIDSGADVRLRGLRHRLRLQQRAAASTNAPFEEPLLGYKRTPLQHLIDVIDAASVRSVGHGTEVASVMLKDLPGAELELIRADEVESAPSVSRLGERWADLIRSSGARVVNVSWVFEQDVASCSDLFRSVVEALPSVLFVFGAGNWSIENPEGACPAGMVSSHRNVITVAGSENTGRSVRLSPSSAYGAAFATVAAPIRAQCGVVRDDGSSALKPCAGTSISAAMVSNLALKMLARAPHLSPPGIIDRIAESCRSEGLDVACGGTIDSDAALRALGE